MSYLVLARKWRPGTFAEVVGQEHVTSTLQKAFEKGRLAHAYLFSGPRGCGKTTTARLLAKIINCEDPQGGEPCNICSSCVAVNEGTHLDMIEIDGASNRGIDEIRDLREKIGYASSQSSSKIYIIDEVHMLTQQAFNALLKTLEEPPGHVYLIFATTEPHKIPATILSRCQRFNFKRLELSELSGQLGRICDSEKIAYDTEALTLICRRADGSMRDAESLLDQCISAVEGKIDLETVRKVLGLVDSQIVSNLLEAVSRRDREAALAVVDGVVDSGMDLEEFFIAFLEGIRNLLVISVSAGRTDWLDLTSGEIEELSGIAGKFEVEDLLFIFRSMSRAHRELKGSSQPRYHIEAAVAEAASWESAVEIGELINRLDSGQGSTAPVSGSSRAGSGGAEAAGTRSTRQRDAGAKAAGPQKADPQMTGTGIAGPGTRESKGSMSMEPESSVPESSGPGSSGPGSEHDPAVQRGSGSSARVDKGSSDVIPGSSVKENPFLASLGGREEWERFLAQVRESKLTLGIWLMAADVAGVEDGSLILSFTSQSRFAMEMIRQAGNKRLIENHLEKFYGRKFTVEACETVDLEGEARADGQAEMELRARTKARSGGKASGPSKGKSASGERQAEGEKSGTASGKKPRGTAGKRSDSSKVDNPTLGRIMEGLDAELLD
jgi:DNA polymerase-3 subunit gamma/tau